MTDNCSLENEAQRVGISGVDETLSVSVFIWNIILLLWFFFSWPSRVPCHSAIIFGPFTDLIVFRKRCVLLSRAIKIVDCFNFLQS